MGRAGRLAVICLGLVVACVSVYLSGWGRPPAEPRVAGDVVAAARPPLLPDDRPVPEGLEKATFASGCFWCTESDFDALEGVVSTTSGYTGGSVAHPTYEQVSAGGTGHVEAVEILFDPSVVTFDALLDHYWRNVDYLNDHGQFCDYGEQYRPVIFVRGAEQRRIAEASKARLQSHVPGRIVVEIADGSVFYPAETYHQDYRSKNPVRYRYYRWGCGRDSRLAELLRQRS